MIVYFIYYRHMVHTKYFLLWYESVDRLWTRVRVRTLGNY